MGGTAGSPDDFTLERFTGEAPSITPVALTATPISLTEGTAATSQAAATFTDPNGDLALSNYQATIDWGDGTSASAASVSGPDAKGIFTVLGSHTYAEESAGTYSIVGTHAYASSGNFTINTAVSVHGSSTLIAGSASIVPTPTPHQL